MADYTYNDMLRMQEEAAERVRAMKKRAALVMDDDKESQKQKSVHLADDVRHYSMPVEFEKTKSKTDDPVIHKTQKQSIMQKITDDKDFLIIIAVLFLISNEKTDYLTILALVYILM